MPLVKPTVGGDNNAWGTTLNTALDNLDVRIAAPSYVGVRTNPFDLSTSFYNVTETSMAKIRGKFAKQSTQRIKVAYIGHSITAGTGTTAIGLNDPASTLRRFLDAGSANVNGTGWVYLNNHPGAMPALGRDYRYTSIGSWTLFAGALYPLATVSATAQTITFVADRPGTIAEVALLSNTGAVDISVDGVLKESYTGPNVVSGTAVPVVKSYTGLSNEKHTITVTTTSATAAWFIGAQVRGTAGIEVSNAGQGGALSGDWGVGNTITNRYVLQQVVAPDVAIISLDTNNMSNGGGGTPYSVTTWAAEMGDLISTLQTAGCAVILQTSTPIGGAGAPLNVTQATVDSYMSNSYTLADSYDVPLIDVNNLFISNSVATANGWMYDIVHPNDIGHAIIARTLADEMIKVYAYDSRIDPLQTEYNAAASPAAPSNGETMFTRNRGRKVLATQDSTGHTTELQSSFVSNRIERHFINAGLTTTVNDGMGAIALVGAFAAQGQAVGNAFTSFARTRMTTAATAGGGVGWRTTARYLLSTVPNVGGGYFTWRGGVATAAAGGRTFIGLSTSSGALSTTTDPSALTNLFGFACDAADTNWQFITNDATGTATKVNLGANFPAKTSSTDWYDLRLFVPSGGGQKVYWSALRIDANGLQYSAAGQYIGTDMPAVNTMLAYHEHFGNGSTAAAASIDFQGAVFEFDN